MSEENKKLKSVVLTDSEIDRTLTRIAHQILEANEGAKNIVFVGVVTRGDSLARRLRHKVMEIEGSDIPYGKLDISFYRDDFATNINPEIKMTDIRFDIDGKDVILVDDILFTGRTIRSALNALMDIGRPKTVQLAVLIDRGHRELPIRADFVGKNVPSSKEEDLRLYLEEVDGRNAVEIYERGGDVSYAL